MASGSRIYARLARLESALTWCSTPIDYGAMLDAKFDAIARSFLEFGIPVDDELSPAELFVLGRLDIRRWLAQKEKTR